MPQDSVVTHEALKRDRQLHGFSEAPIKYSKCAWPRPHALRRRVWPWLPAPLSQGPWLTPFPTCRHYACSDKLYAVQKIWTTPPVSCMRSCRGIHNPMRMERHAPGIQTCRLAPRAQTDNRLQASGRTRHRQSERAARPPQRARAPPPLWRPHAPGAAPGRACAVLT